jgi:flagellar hook-length control protein FliK
MTISLIPVAVADPPAPSGAAPASRSGASFGQYIDNADAQASDNAARARRDSASNRRRDNHPAPSSDSASNQPAQQPTTQAPAASSDQPIGKAGKSHSSDHAASSTGGKQGKNAAGGDGQSTDDKASQPAEAPVVAMPVVLAPIVPPITDPIVVPATASASLPTSTDKGALPRVPAMKADAGATGLSSLIGSSTKVPGTWQAAVAATSAKTDSNTTPATPATSDPTVSAGTQQGDVQAAVKSTATIPVATDASVLATPPIVGPTTSATTIPAGTTPPVTGSASHRGTLSAQASALLNRVAAPGTAQHQIPAAATTMPPAGAAATPVSGATTRGAIAAAVTAPTAAGAAPNDAAPIAAAPATGTPAATQGTPLPPVSGAVDLSAKFSATALPARGDALAPAAKAKTDSHLTASPTGPIAASPVATPAAATAETAATAGAAKPTGDAPPAGEAMADSGVPSDDAVAAPTTSSAPIGPQPRGDTAGLPNGTAAVARAPDATVAPVAALHSVPEQVAISLKRGVKEGSDQIQINLEPASLGKIAIRLDFAQDGRVTATFSADRPDTLTLLNQDSRALEQSLRDAGLRADSGSLTFNLSGGDNGANARQFAQSASYAATAAATDSDDPLAPAVAARSIANGLSRDGGLDIHV